MLGETAISRSPEKKSEQLVGLLPMQQLHLLRFPPLEFSRIFLKLFNGLLVVLLRDLGGHVMYIRRVDVPIL